MSFGHIYRRMDSINKALANLGGIYFELWQRREAFNLTYGDDINMAYAYGDPDEPARLYKMKIQAPLCERYGLTPDKFERMIERCFVEVRKVNQAFNILEQQYG